MTARIRGRGSLLCLVVVALTLGACAGLGPQPSAEVTTLSPAWPNWFTLDWTQEAEPSGSRKISGYVRNAYGEEATEVRLLTQALDKSGAVVGQRFTWAGNVTGLSRVYFEVRNMPAAESYRVTVWAFSFHQSLGWQ
jgi:hypothetical protein